MRRHLLGLVALLLALALVPARCAANEIQVDLELVIAVDVSLSMDLDEQRLQRDGYVQAFRDPEIIKAIRGGAYGRIAVVYFEWAGPDIQKVSIPWTIIDGAEAATRFADRLAAEPITRERMTSVSSALLFADRLLETNNIKGVRRVIDVSGDGPNNAGVPVVPVRNQMLDKGVTINGLPIVLKRGGPNSYFDLPDLDVYYAECVIGGAGAFMIPIKETHEFLTATRRKLLLEIAGTEPRLWRAQAKSERPEPNFDCLVGERMRQRYFMDR